jgi:hypothetical protein
MNSKTQVSTSALESLKKMAQEVQDQRDILLAALIDARSVTNSVSMGRDRRVVRDGCVLFLQTEEWCKWANEEVNEKVFAAIARCKESTKVFE